MDLTAPAGASAAGWRSRKSRKKRRMPAEPASPARNEIFIVLFHCLTALIEGPDSPFPSLRRLLLRAFAGGLLLLRHNKDQTQ